MYYVMVKSVTTAVARAVWAGVSWSEKRRWKCTVTCRLEPEGREVAWCREPDVRPHANKQSVFKPGARSGGRNSHAPADGGFS